MSSRAELAPPLAPLTSEGAQCEGRYKKGRVPGHRCLCICMCVCVRCMDRSRSCVCVCMRTMLHTHTHTHTWGGGRRERMVDDSTAAFRITVVRFSHAHATSPVPSATRWVRVSVYNHIEIQRLPAQTWPQQSWWYHQRRRSSQRASGLSNSGRRPGRQSKRRRRYCLE